MPRIVDKDTRIIDVDFGTVKVGFARAGGSFNPTSLNITGNGTNSIINSIPVPNAGAASYVQYRNLDLSFMLKENDIMVPVSANIQRTSPVPRGYSNNGNTFDQVEEYIYILTRPLNNDVLRNMTTLNSYENLRNMGLDGCEGNSATFFGLDGSVPNLQQCVYAEKRMYGTNTNLIASQSNGTLIQNQPYNTIEGMLGLQSVTTWGSLDAITGPNLHCYRVIIDRGQTFPPVVGAFQNEQFDGDSQRIWPPVNISFLCKDPKYTDGEYITRLANAMANTPEGGQTA